MRRGSSKGARAPGDLRIVQFGLPYSPNLGDGIISECLSYGVARVCSGARVDAIDLSTRSDFGETVVRNRRLALKLLGALPRPIRHRLVKHRLRAMLDAAAPGWAGIVADADMVLIGGGQLFSDADLNFPLKIARAAEVARDGGVPVSVYAAGVAHNWSAEGTALYRTLLDADLRAVGLRDGPSIDAWRAQFGAAGPDPVLMRDPGLLARGCYGPVAADTRIGLCVSDPAILRYHADRGTEGVAKQGLAPLAQALVARGHRLRLFCNGAAEDAAALQDLAHELQDAQRSGDVEVADPPTRPNELAQLAGGCSALVAHRLHACIVGYAYRRPVVGLGWDRKVESFFASVGQGAAFSPAGEPPDAIVARLERSIAQPFDAERAEEIEGEVLAGLRSALAPAIQAPAS